MRMDTERDDAVLVRSIIELGRNLGLRVTAEGVESARTHRTLRALGCDFAQGYHISKPVPPEQCRRVLEASPGPFRDRRRDATLSRVAPARNGDAVSAHAWLDAD
jgi:EAL domain-containing protein (putative c-di-GMP-specific phosphodiesterase class I)